MKQGVAMKSLDGSGESPEVSGKPGTSDLLFLAFLVLVTGITVHVGRITYREGVNTNLAKANGEALAKWMARTSTERAASDFVPSACRASSAGAEATTWGGCRASLFGPGGSQAERVNPFSGTTPRFVTRCSPADRASAGEIVVERIVAGPPGSTSSVSQLLEKDTLPSPLALRVSICDRGGYPVRIADVDF